MPMSSRAPGHLFDQTHLLSAKDLLSDWWAVEDPLVTADRSAV